MSLIALLNHKTVRLLAGITGVAALLIFLIIESQSKGDFYIFTLAASDLPAHENIFEKKYVDGYHYFYSVFFALLLKPFLCLPFPVSKFIWLSLNCFFAWRIFHIIKNFLPLNNFTEKERLTLKAAGILFSLRFVWENLHSGQITILILFLALQGLQLVFMNKPAAGALLIALGINIKLLPVVLIPYLFYRRFFVAGILSVLFYALMLFIPAFFIGWDYNQQLLHTWLGLVNPMNSEHVLDVEERSFHGLSTLLSTLLVKNVPDVYALPLRRNIADITPEQLGIVLNTVRAILVLFTFYFLKTLPFKKSLGMKFRFREISYILLLVPLIFPHQQHYAFLFACPAFTFCVYYLIQNRKVLSKGKYYFILAGLILVYLSGNLKMLLGEFNEYYEHFKILTYGALLLIILLAACEPGKEEDSVI